MSEKDIIEKLAKQLPMMTERERRYIEGAIATAVAMSSAAANKAQQGAES